MLRLISQPNIRAQLSDEVVESIGKGLTQVREHLAGIVQDGSQANVYHRAPQQAVDIFWCLFIGVLEASDARGNLDMPGASYTELSQAAFFAIDAAVRAPDGAQPAAEVAA